MLQTLFVRQREHLEDCVGQNITAKIYAALNIPVQTARVVKVFTIAGISQEELRHALETAILHDPVLHDASENAFPSTADWILEVGFRPGVTDNEGRTAKETLALVLGKKKNLAVYTATQYHLWGSFSRETVQSIGTDLLANELIQRVSIKNKQEWQEQPGFPKQAAEVLGAASDEVSIIPFSTMTDKELIEFSRANTLALSLEELLTIKKHYACAETINQRKTAGLPKDPTDAEIEVLAQTWSEHCKHKIFSSWIYYENKETGHTEQISSLYKTYIQDTTKQLRAQMGGDDFCRSVFKDNAGVVAFNETHDVCIKVETHNSPSALDPYGGALTGIVGVNRDPMGTGLGAELVCNTDVFCFASPFYEGELPPRLLHPRRVMEGVREGVEHGGNKSGVPTVNGSIVFDDRFLGKPLVYCGTVGMIPKLIAGRPGYEKKAGVGDAIVMAGGRIGKDGIHGATFSSEELHEGSPATAVQIGDPITQRKLYDFIIKARNLGLYSAITDNGAGGLSSSVGEMAEDTGGCILDLSCAPLKYDGLKPWEILLSEAQERMTLAVPQANLPKFMELAEEMDVEASHLGEFTDSGFFHATYGKKSVAFLSMQFLHDGLPQMQLKAVWERPKAYPLGQSSLYTTQGQEENLDTLLQKRNLDQNELLLNMLGRLNICSKEYLIRQYDHEVKGGSVVKPLIGIKKDGPADAAVIRPILTSNSGIVLSHGICPKFSDADTYWMMANAIDEAVRNAIAVGADPKRLAGVDNFCWCDPVQSEKTPDGEYKLAQLVRANKALAHFCLAYSLPCISGKDSMKNDYTGGGEKISIPPTVLFSVLGIMKDVNLAQTSDFKNAGDGIYLLGITKRELAGSEIAAELGLAGGAVPEVDAVNARKRYELLHKCMQEKLVNSCHDLSDGGLAVAIAEMALAGRLGARINLAKVPAFNVQDITELLYAESASRLLVTVSRDNIPEVQRIWQEELGYTAALIGNVADHKNLIIANGEEEIINLHVEKLATAFKSTFAW